MLVCIEESARYKSRADEVRRSGRYKYRPGLPRKTVSPAPVVLFGGTKLFQAATQVGNMMLIILDSSGGELAESREKEA
jgi:hypothetical protein